MPQVVITKDVRALRAGQVLDLSQIDANIYVQLGIARHNEREHQQPDDAGAAAAETKRRRYRRRDMTAE